MTLACVCLAALGGCTVGKDYSQPDLPVEKSFATTRPTTGPATAPADLGEWWRKLEDPILNDLIAQAAASSLDMKLAVSRVTQSRAFAQVAGAANYPQVNVGANYSWNQLSKNEAPYNAFPSAVFPWSFNDYSAGFDASWELDVFGQNRRTIEAANADIQAVEDYQRAVLLSVYGEITRNYLDLRGLQRATEITQDTVKLQQQTLELNQDRFAKGTGTDLDVARAKAQLATTQAVLPQLLTLQWQSLHRLALLLAVDLDPLAAKLSPHQAIPTVPAGVSLGIPADLLRRRPDIRSAERQLAAATARTGAARADLYPKLSIAGGFGVAAENPSNLLDRDSIRYNVGPGISWPIFDGGRIRGMIKVRNAQQEQALIGYEQTVRRSIAEVRDAAVAFSQEHDRRRSLTEAVAANRDALDMSRQLYDRGLADFLSVLDAQRSLYQTEDALNRSQLIEATSYIALCKALGGGWETQLPLALLAATQPTTKPSK